MTTGEKMIDFQDLVEFENAIKSGKLEDCFRNGTEEGRYQILGLLEKFMDVAELADEAATRMIFRGKAMRNSEDKEQKLQ